jgi:hypothetical protein
VKLFCPFVHIKILNLRLREIAEKAMGEIAYNTLGKNTYLPAPGASDS